MSEGLARAVVIVHAHYFVPKNSRPEPDILGALGAHLVYISRVIRPNGRPWAQNVRLIPDLVQPLAHRLFGLAANLIANSYG